MANRYNFQGGAAGNAIQEFLVQREMQNRQQMLAELQRKAQADQVAQEEADRALRAQDLALRQQQEQRITAAQQAAMDDLANQREFGQVERAVEGARPDDAPLDPTMVEKVQRQGFGSRLRQIPGVLMQGPIESGDQMSETDREAELGRTPEQMGLRPGSRFLDAEAQREATAALAGQAEAGRNERAQAEMEMRQMIAALAARGDAKAAALDARLKELQIAGMEDKQAAAATERARGEKSRTETAQTALTLLDRLEQHPGFGMAYGNVSSRFAGFNQNATDAGSIRDQVVAALTLPNLGSLKGPMSDKDILFVKQLATRLQNPRISEAEARNAIAEARKRLGGDASATPAAGTPKRKRYDANGNPLAE